MAQGNSKLDPWSIECKLLGYASGSGNYRVQDVKTSRVFVSRDVVFEEGQPCCTSAKVGEEIETLNFDTNIDSSADNGHNVQATHQIEHISEQTKVHDQTDQITVRETDHHCDIPTEPR